MSSNAIPFAARVLALAKELASGPGLSRKRAESVLAIARAVVIFRQCERGRRVRAFTNVRVVADGRIALGDNVFFFGGMLPSELLCGPGAELTIGEGSGFNYGVSIDARQSVTIGRRCMFGAMSRVSDASSQRVAPVVIGDDVWLAHGAIIEAGVTIGEGSAVSAGSVVTLDLPPKSLAIGNPARAVPLDLRRSGRG